MQEEREKEREFAELKGGQNATSPAISPYRWCSMPLHCCLQRVGRPHATSGQSLTSSKFVVKHSSSIPSVELCTHTVTLRASSGSFLSSASTCHRRRTPDTSGKKMFTPSSGGAASRAAAAAISTTRAAVGSTRHQKCSIDIRLVHKSSCRHEISMQSRCRGGRRVRSRVHACDSVMGVSTRAWPQL
jgi:hypothetical protein